MTKAKKTVTIALLSVMAAAVVLPVTSILRAVDPPAVPAAPVGRPLKAILKDLAAASDQFDAALKDKNTKDLLDEDVRTELGPKVMPPMRKMAALFRELEAVAKPEMKDEIVEQRRLLTSMLVVVGDAETVAALDEAIKGPDKDEALAAALCKKLGQYWLSGDEKEQARQIESVFTLATDSKTRKAVRGTLTMMANLGAATIETKYKAIAAIDSFVDGVGKPVDLAGTTVTGRTFSTKEYAGKVILIDFWATWCGPCKAELPHVKALYKKYHEKGLEIVGVSCDSDGQQLVEFTQQEDMTWVELWDKTKQTSPETQWHPLATEWKVDGIPTMFLIDRNGILRTTEARGSLDEMIPKMLAEKVKVPAPVPAPK
jgi:thiol-disulfide isomerase/thioredoxin